MPEIRTDLQLIEGPVSLDGSPSWIIYDPPRNRYFSIGWTAFQLLSRWSAGTASVLLAILRKETSLNVNINDVKNLISFLYKNSLTKTSVTKRSDAYLAQYRASQPHFFVWLIRHYLFFRFPLFRPTKFLRNTLEYVEPIYSKTTAAFIVSIGLIGLYLVGRQWDEFTSTFIYFFNPQGIAFYFVALVIIKILHELAHGYTAVKHGCKISTMGVAFMVLVPMLYTDTTDTWRIRSPKERIQVGAAGMTIEFYIACLATFSWGFLPDGILRSATFVLATTGWVLSLFINSNVLMRFDGYYILSDILGIQNLQERSFAVGRWRLTELLFDLKLRPPEALPSSMLRKLTLYAWSVWIYRLLLFIGIAFLVYTLFFKLLGIILFLVEIIWFIVIPIFGMLKYWWGMRKNIIKTRRFLITATIFIFFVGIMVYPWNSSVTAPALFETREETTLYSPAPAYIENSYLVKGGHVNQNELLITLKSPLLEHEIETTLKEIEILQIKARRIAASLDDLSNIKVIVQELQEKRSTLNGLNEKKNNLIIRAPIEGVVYDMEESLHEGRWINTTIPIATIVKPQNPYIQAIISESDLSRFGVHASAKFIPDNPQLDSIWGYVRDIELANLDQLDIPVLASVYGGPIASEYSEKGELVTKKSKYRVHIDVSSVEKTSVRQIIRGVVHIDGKPRSFLKHAYQIVASVFVRESGF